MNLIQKVKQSWDDSVPNFRHKVSAMLRSGDENKSVTVNPFLDRNGKAVNPYLNYQKVLESNTVSDKAKNFIRQAAQVTSGSSGMAQTVGTLRPTAETAQGGASASGIADAAQKYIGTPYVWGGESMAEGGMDCSGFVYNALKDAGYNVGRTTAQGYRSYGTSVSRADMQPGDLIFYGSGDNASHVGIYLGNGRMIHSSGGSKNTASNPGKGVSVTNVDYRNDFIEARRY